MPCSECQHREEELDSLRMEVRYVTLKCQEQEDECAVKISKCSEIQSHYRKLVGEMEQLKQIYAEKIEGANKLYYEHQALLKKCDPSYAPEEDLDKLASEIDGLWM